MFVCVCVCVRVRVRVRAARGSVIVIGHPRFARGDRLKKENAMLVSSLRAQQVGDNASSMEAL
jgi:hypothetical protein